MIKLKTINLIFLFLICLSINAQNIDFDLLFSKQIYAKRIDGFTSLKDGNYYVIHDQKGLQKHSFKTFEKVETILNDSFDDFIFSDSENKILLSNLTQSIYRHSQKAIFNVYDVKTKQKQLIFEGKLIQEPLFSPDETKVAFVYENNLFYQDLTNKKIVQITKDGKKNQIINGICDWVYEEEFGFVRHFDWTKDSKNLAFVRFDESQVNEVFIPIYAKDLYPQEIRFKYPKAGEKNSEVSLNTFNLETNKVNKINLNSVENYYLVKIVRTNKNNEILLVSSNRLHNKVDVSSIDLKDLKVNKLFTETDKAWIETDEFKVNFLVNNDFIWSSEKNGFRHLYLFNQIKKELNPLTSGNYEVTDFYGFDEKNNKLYFQSTEKSSIYRNVYSLNIKTNKKELLTSETGTNQALFNSDFTNFMNVNSSINKAPIYTLRNSEGKIIKTLEDNQDINSVQKQTNVANIEFLEIENSNSDKLNTWILKPKNFNPQKKYPVLMYVYGGPNSQKANDSWTGFYYWWFQYLASKDYIVVCSDGRGTGGKGADFKKSIYKQLGKYEIEDQISVAKYLQKQSFVDSQRIGMFGWSFGGYMSSLALTKGEGVFKAAIAVAPVTSWRFYDTVYTEKFLQTPQENSKGYDDNSPINFVNQFKGNYLLIHGTADDNVHFQNSTQMSEALVQQGLNFDYFAYTDKDHGIYGGKTRFHLFKKISDFIFEKL